MLSIDDESLLPEFEQEEFEQPSPTKVIDETRTIYGSRKLGLPKNSLWGQPVLCDFGEARIGETHKGLIQPELYRAPEVLFNMEWNYSADLWNVATLVSLPIPISIRQIYLLLNLSILDMGSISGSAPLSCSGRSSRSVSNTPRC